MDFTVFGLARSGTTALSNCINLHPNAFCANEFFGAEPNKNVMDEKFPDIFINQPNTSESKMDKIRSVLAQKKHVKVYGNKYPRHYLYLDEWSGYFPKIKHIGIYREDFSFMYSWNERANSKSWHPGRTGAIGVIEQVALLTRVLHAKKTDAVYLFSYNRLFRDDPDHCENLFKILGLDCDELLKDQFEKKYYLLDKVFSKIRPETIPQSSARNFFNIDQVDRIFRKYSARPISDYPQSSVEELNGVLTLRLPAYLANLIPDLSLDEKKYLIMIRKILIETPLIGGDIDNLLEEI